MRIHGGTEPVQASLRKRSLLRGMLCSHATRRATRLASFTSHNLGCGAWGERRPTCSTLFVCTVTYSCKIGRKKCGCGHTVHAHAHWYNG